MKTVVFKGVELHIDDNNTLTTNEVAAGYGVTPQSIREHKRHHADEIFENVHYIVKTNKFNKPSLHWTIEGAYMLGFFIKSKEAKEFRKFTAKLLSEIKQGNAKVVSVAPTQLDMITHYEVRRDLATTRRLLTIEKKKHRQTAEYYEKKLLQLQKKLPSKSIEEDDIARVKQAINHKLKNTIRIKTNDMVKTLGILIDFATNEVERVLRDADISEDLTWYDEKRDHFKELLK